jgi:CDP-glucose 4,6-dehydratase
MTLFKDVYQGKKIFLTGHTGFKGSWMLTWLHLLGAEIKGYSLAPDPQHQLYGQIGGDSLCKSEFNDILNYTAIEQSILDFQPDIIFHLAAQAIVRTSYEQPIETFNTNSIGTAHVLNVSRKLSRPCILVMITTDKVYHNNEWHYSYRETDRLGGFDPYSASKACAELIIDSYRNSYFNHIDFIQHQKSLVVARAGNVIGGGDWAKDRILPDIIRALQKKEPVIIRNPGSVRPWQHVLEPLHAYLMLGAKLLHAPLHFSAEYNFGPRTTDCWTVKKMVECAINVWGSGSYEITQHNNMPHEAGVLKLDISRAEIELDWTPTFSAEQAIDRSVHWYKKFNGQNAYQLISDDIQFFSNRLQN